jgi:glycosyltransferase involved in cell wall biosynthesis
MSAIELRLVDPRVTVVIVTKNRCNELRKALESATEQQPPVNILVIDDGSTDETATIVQSHFPEVRYERRCTSAGCVVRRNEAARLISSEFIVSIDDDAVFSDSSVVAKTLSEFSHPQVGAVAIPFVNVKDRQVVRQRAPENRGVYIAATFIGTAYAVRRHVFVELGGYRELLHGQYEEADFCARMLDAGYVVRLGTAPAIYHHESPHRVCSDIVFYGERNQVLFVWFNLPQVFRPLGGVFWRGLCRGYRLRCLGVSIRGLISGIIESVRFRHKRHPIKRKTQCLLRSLAAAPICVSPADLDSMID